MIKLTKLEDNVYTSNRFSLTNGESCVAHLKNNLLNIDVYINGRLGFNGHINVKSLDQAESTLHLFQQGFGLFPPRPYVDSKTGIALETPHLMLRVKEALCHH